MGAAIDTDATLRHSLPFYPHVQEAIASLHFLCLITIFVLYNGIGPLQCIWIAILQLLSTYAIVPI